MLIQDMTREQVAELAKSNKWLAEKISEQAWDDAMFRQGEEFKLVGADVFGYHDHYSSFYLTCPTVGGGKAPEKLVGKLDTGYMSEEDGKLYKELLELNEKMEDAEEWDEDCDEYDKMIEIANTLAEHITEQLRAYEDTTAYEEQIIDDIADGYNWLGELEVEDGVITEVVKHK